MCKHFKYFAPAFCIDVRAGGVTTRSLHVATLLSTKLSVKAVPQAPEADCTSGWSRRVHSPPVNILVSVGEALQAEHLRNTGNSWALFPADTHDCMQAGSASRPQNISSVTQSWHPHARKGHQTTEQQTRQAGKVSRVTGWMVELKL